MNLLSARDLSFSYPGLPSFLLSGVRLDLEPSSLTGLLGPNGSGKSTLLRLLAGLAKPSRGEVLFEGRPLSSLTEADRAKRLAFVPQSFSPSFSFTAWDLVMMGRFPHLGRFAPPGARDRAIAERALRLCDAEAFRDRPFDELSGGERQRVLVASALAQQPRVLLLDEPAAGLDLGHQVALFDLLADLSRREGLCVVCALHDLNQAARTFPRVVLMNHGRLVGQGAPSRILTARRVRSLYGVSVRRLGTGRKTPLFVPVSGGAR